MGVVQIAVLRSRYSPKLAPLSNIHCMESVGSKHSPRTSTGVPPSWLPRRGEKTSSAAFTHTHTPIIIMSPKPTATFHMCGYRTDHFHHPHILLSLPSTLYISIPSTITLSGTRLVAMLMTCGVREKGWVAKFTLSPALNPICAGTGSILVNTGSPATHWMRLSAYRKMTKDMNPSDARIHWNVLVYSGGSIYYNLLLRKSNKTFTRTPSKR